MQIYLSDFTNFKGQPGNYLQIDNFLSRSAQPAKEDFVWLKERGITDVFNFRTMYKTGTDFVEKDVVESLGMNYHNIPSITKSPSETNIFEFLNRVEDIKQKGGKAHIHCKAGADRTGMYAFIYKTLKGISTVTENRSEWIKMGHNIKLYPDLIGWTENFLKKIKK